MGEEGLPRIFEKRSAKDNFWRLIEYVQTCVKDSVGIGKPINVHFFAPLDENIELNKDMADDLFLLEEGRYKDFCVK